MKDWKYYEERAKKLREIIECNTKNGALIKDLANSYAKTNDCDTRDDILDYLSRIDGAFNFSSGELLFTPEEREEAIKLGCREYIKSFETDPRKADETLLALNYVILREYGDACHAISSALDTHIKYAEYLVSRLTEDEVLAEVLCNSAKAEQADSLKETEKFVSYKYDNDTTAIVKECVLNVGVFAAEQRRLDKLASYDKKLIKQSETGERV